MPLDLSELYQEIILEHSRKPRNFGVLAVPPAREGLGVNPSCGDKLMLYALFNEGRLADLKHSSEGCAIFKASCSLLSGILRGKTPEEAEELLEVYLRLITLDAEPPTAAETILLGKLQVFHNIRNYPARVKCAALFARTLQALLRGESEAVNTEGE